MRNLLILSKFILTALLIIWALSGVDFSVLQNIIWSKKGLALLATATTIVLVQTVFAGYRLKPILKLFDKNISGIFGINIWFLGNFFSQFLISFVGSDAMRTVGLVRRGITTSTAWRAIFLDRVVSFIALQLSVLLALPFMLQLITTPILYYGLIFLALACTGMILGFVIFGYIPDRFRKIRYIGKIIEICSISRYLRASKGLTLQIFVLSMLVQLCNIAAIYFLCRILGAHISMLNAFIIGAPVALLTMLPISVGGWGIRENAMITGLGLVGITADVALTVSLIIGLSFIFGSLPGAFVLFAKKSTTFTADVSLAGT